jgi:hypothetical protein
MSESNTQTLAETAKPKDSPDTERSAARPNHRAMPAACRVHAARDLEIRYAGEGRATARSDRLAADTEHEGAQS